MDELSWLFTLTFDRNTITYVRVTNSSPVTSIRYLYSRRSDTVQILESSFEEDFTNVEDFSNKSLMSRTNFFSAPQTSDSLLSETSSGSIRASSFDW